MKWAFIDYENIHSLEKVGDLSAYARIIVFLGAKQQSINFGELRSHKMLNLSVIQIEAVADNNLDFHLTYYLGLFDKQENNEIQFDVISNDKGFDGVIAHVNKLGRSCTRVKVITEPKDKTEQKPVAAPPQNPKTKQQPDKVNVDRVEQYFREHESRNRPKTLQTLRNHINSILKLEGNEVLARAYVNQLVTRKLISINNSSVTYLFPGYEGVNNEAADKLITYLTKRPAKQRPQSIAALSNFIDSHLKLNKDEKSLAKWLGYLTDKGIVVLDAENKKVTYCGLEKGGPGKVRLN